MTAESGHTGDPMALAFVESYAGSLTGEFMVGPPNEDGRQIRTYPLTPLRWQAARTLADTVSDACWSKLVGDSTIPPEYDPGHPRPRLFADAGISAVSFDSLIPDVRDGSEPVVFFPYGGWLITGRIPDRHLTAVPSAGRFLWANRFSGVGRFGAGRLYAGRVVMAQAVSSVDVVPVAEVPSTIPAY